MNVFIEAIHNKEAFTFNGEYALTDPLMFERFATAQAIAIADIQGDISVSNVARAGREMVGRKVGIPR